MSVQTKKYDNGFRVVYQKSVGCSDTTSIQVFCNIGSIHEPEESRGSAHFIEHMCFNGTKKLKTSRNVNLIFDKTGSVSNAFTDRRYTLYFVTTDKTNASLCISTLADMLLNSVFDKNVYLKEREVVKEEAIKDEDDYELLAQSTADKQLYAGSPYENTVDELKYHVGKLNLKYENVLKTYKKYYIPSNLILSVCSSLSFDEVCKFAEQSDFVKQCHTEPIPALNLYIKPQTDVVYYIQKRHTTPAHLCIGFRSCSMTNADKYPIKLLKTILSGKINSRMFMILREENGLTYTSYANTDFFEHLGDFKLYAECESSKLMKNGAKPGVFPILTHMIDDLIKNGVTEEEITTAKGFIKGMNKMNSEDPYVIAKYNGKNTLFGITNAPSYVDKFQKRIQPVTRADIHACIKRYFKREGMVVSVVCGDPPSETELKKFVDKISFSV